MVSFAHRGLDLLGAVVAWQLASSEPSARSAEVQPVRQLQVDICEQKNAIRDGIWCNCLTGYESTKDSDGSCMGGWCLRYHWSKWNTPGWGCIPRYCSQHSCGTGKLLKPDAGQRLCTDYTGDIYDPGSFFSLIECRDDRCCDPFGECQDFTCGDGLMDKAGKSSIVCSTATCDELECCDIDPCADGYAFLEGGRTGTWCICKPGYIINDRGDGVDNGNRYPLANVGVAGYFCLATTTTTTFTSTTSTTSSTLPVVHCPPGYREKPATSYFRRTCKIPTLCDPEGDLETFCDQLCESFDCTGYSRTKENASDIVCIGRCDPFIDRRTCCEYFPAVDEGAKLLTAAMTKEAHQVDRLVAMGVDTSSSSGDGSTALHFAGLHDNSESVKRLLEGRADPNALDVRGWSPLHVAAGRGHVSSVNLLVDYRAIPDLKSHDGMTAREVALRVAGPSHGPRRPQAEVAVILARAERAWKDELAWAASLPMEAVPPNHARHYEKEHRKARMEL